MRKKVVDYLLLHDVSSYYIRSIPVQVHTKFLKDNQRLIIALLKTIRPDRFASPEDDLESLLSLQLKPQLFTIRWLDPKLSREYLYGMEVTGVPVDWLKQLRWPVREVWIVENE